MGHNHSLAVYFPSFSWAYYTACAETRFLSLNNLPTKQEPACPKATDQTVPVNGLNVCRETPVGPSAEIQEAGQMAGEGSCTSHLQLATTHWSNSQGSTSSPCRDLGESRHAVSMRESSHGCLRFTGCQILKFLICWLPPLCMCEARAVEKISCLFCIKRLSHSDCKQSSPI